MAGGLLESIDRSTQLAGHNRLALLLFRLDERQIFGINVFKVQEVIPAPSLSRMPASHPLVRGVAELRGVVVPIIDLAQALGGPAGDAAHVIVTEYNRSVQGFLVRGVERIIHVDVAAVQPPPTHCGDCGYLTAVTLHGQELVAIVDVEKVLAEVLGEPPALSMELVGTAQALGSGRRVLVADDSRVARGQVERVLQQLGVECVIVNDGREALDYLHSLAARGPVAEQLLMVISDIEMPAMDGYSLTAEIRRDPRLRDLHVLLHTSLSGVFNKAMVQKVGANRFVSKFSTDELAQGVIERLQAAAADRQAAA
jgi:two-component system, chemotaxis family, chemotaxis protein CheV